MRLVTVGFLQPDDIEGLEGQCCVVLVGSPEEVRAVAPLLYQDVAIGVSVSMSAPFPAAPSGGADRCKRMARDCNCVASDPGVIASHNAGDCFADCPLHEERMTDDEYGIAGPPDVPEDVVQEALARGRLGGTPSEVAAIEYAYNAGVAAGRRALQAPCVAETKK